MLESLFFVSLWSAFIILFIQKIGLRDYAQTFAPKVLSNLFSCDFCLAFWLSVLISFIFYIFGVIGSEAFYLPFMAAPLIRILL
tara:strand:+ start:270 stop:521 length:252 start_codon:yes stop_codon:yes gene_type:complete